MNSHSNTELLKKMYADFVEGNIPSMLSACADNVTFQLAGKSPLAGKYDRSTFVSQFMPRLMELSGGTFKMEVHDVLASDRHGMVLATNRLTRGGKALEYRTVHVWRMEGGKPLAGYEYLRDQYAFDQIWSG